MILWKYEAKYVSEFRFGERDIPRLSEALQWPHKIVCCQESVANNIEELHIILKILSCPWFLSSMVSLFKRNPTEFCDI